MDDEEQCQSSIKDLELETSAHSVLTLLIGGA